MNVTISEDDLKDIIEKLKLDLLKYTSSQENPDNWLDSVPEKHRKFAAYWDDIGRPKLEATCKNMAAWINIIPDWSENLYYRIKDDQHWELRLKWVNSDKTLPIEIYDTYDKKWQEAPRPSWLKDYKYREAKLWYEQEISKAKPIVLIRKERSIEVWDCLPYELKEYRPLTDQEIDALKRGF